MVIHGKSWYTKAPHSYVVHPYNRNPKIHHLLLIYFHSKPVHVSSRLAAHHQEGQLFTNSNCYSHALRLLAAACKQVLK